MKSLIIILFGIGVNICFCQIINIPDVNLKTKLTIADQITYRYAKNASGNWIRIDTNFDGEIQISEALLVKELSLRITGSNIDNWPVQSIEGLQYFINLELLNCSSNPILMVSDLHTLINLKNLSFWNCSTLSSINLVGLSSLEILSLSNNNLTQIDLTGLSLLKNIDCSINQLSSLNFVGLPYLYKVVCFENQINTLDFSENPLLKQLYCSNNNLTNLNIKNGINHDFAFSFYNDCWKTGNPNLTSICVDASEQASVQSFLDGCNTAVPTPTLTSSNCGLANEQFAKNEVTVFPNPATSIVNINSNETIKTLELYDFQGRLLESEKVNTNQTTLDVSEYSKGIYFVKSINENSNKVVKIIIE
jgi:hypothetical protein